MPKEPQMPEPDDFPGGEIVAEMYCHLVYWISRLRPVLTPEMLAKACEAMDQAMFAVEGEALAAGGTENHLHILVRISPDHSLQEVLDATRRCCNDLTGNSRGKKKSPWHEDDVSVSISPCQLGEAKEYLANQASHHEIVSFQSELKALFDEHGFDYDERKLWG